jgi:eukaryotic-like serine/threonine-protein kinase
MKIDRYEVTRLLGEGAMGKVFLATDPKLHREVAVKVLAGGAKR